MRGSLQSIIITIITSVIGVIALSGAIEGFVLTKTKWIERLLFGAGSILLIMPGLNTDLFGALFLAIATFSNWINFKKYRYATVVE
jgi:TRAP-type uncharacterized transport system fused permease subunit